MQKVSSENYTLQKEIAVLAVLLFSVKIIAYLLTHSTAILADVMETSVNVVAAFIGLAAIFISLQPADSSHPFGHGKAELISALIEGSMITIAGVIMILESVDSILHPHEVSDLGIGILLIIAAGAINFFVGKAAIRRGQKNMSPALVASGRHLVSDTYVAIGVITGLAVVYAAMEMGYDAVWLDSAIALVFSIVIIITGARVVRESMDDIMDKSDEDLLQQVVDTLQDHRHSDWIDIFGMRIMKHGCRIYVDFRVVLPKDMSVEDVAREERELQEAICEKMGEDVEISMTPVPCGDDICWECGKHCEGRSRGFMGYREWTVETVTAESSQFAMDLSCGKPIIPRRGFAGNDSDSRFQSTDLDAVSI